MRAVLPLLALATSALAAVYDHDATIAAELRSRDGLPNLFAKVKAGGSVRIAYLGGSITAASGWRVKSLAWFREQFPLATFSEINAAISGTGSDYGACRIQQDVLSREPDLVFLECRVNGGGGFEAQSVEGIVRQIWKHNPRTDICFVYTIGQWMLPALQAGKNVPFGAVMETLANRYGIPTIDLGVEVAKREQAGTLVFKASAPVEGKLVFSGDGVHPGDAGHGLYRDIIARSFLLMMDVGQAQDHTLGAPLDARCWETATLLPVSAAIASPGWTAVDAATDPVYNDDAGRTKAMLRGALASDRIGASLTVRWNGTTVGLSDIPHAGPMIVEALIDGTTTVTLKRVQTEAAHRYARFCYLPEQAPGDHTACFTIRELPAGAAFYAGQFLIVGTPSR